MALKETNTANGNFFSIKHGGFCLEADKPTDGYTETEVNNPSLGKMVTKWIKTFAAIEGKVGRIDWYDRTHGGTRYLGIKIIVRDNGESYSIDLPFGKRHYNYFMRVMDSIDYEKPVEFIAYGKKDEQGRDYTEFAVKQNGKWLNQNYTKANPGDCPQSVQDAMGKWDSRDRHIWLKNRLETIIIPHVAELNDTGDQDEPVYDEPAFAGPVSQNKSVAAGVGTGPNDEAAFKAASKYDLDAPPEDDGIQIPF